MSLILYHGPNSRSAGVLQLLHELDAKFDLKVLQLKAGEQRRPEYLAINPMGKVPAIVHDGAVITEQPAIYIYLADLYAERGLAPGLGDRLRGPYLRWMTFYGSCFEPAMIDRALKREPARAASSPYGEFDTMFATLNAQMAAGPYMLGEKFLALDVLWGSALTWMSKFGLLPESPVIARYVERAGRRPLVAKLAAEDAGRVVGAGTRFRGFAVAGPRE